MHRTKRIQINKALALLLSLSLILTAVFGGTFAQIITRTPSFINTFLSGLDPTGDLVIRKEVTHPFGSGYAIPNGLSFDFTVSLGADYAGKTVETSQGDMTADESGNITVSATPDGAVRIMDLMDGTSVTVTESPSGAFTPDGGAEKSITIQSGDNTITYNNVYAPGPVDPVNVTVTGTKLLEGRDWQEGDSFTFQLEYKLAGNDTWQNAGTASVAYDPANADFNKFSFTELVKGITYTSAGTYSFRVSEVEGTVGGITYDKVVSYFDVLVGDADMNGSLEIQDVTGYQNAAASYDPSTDTYHVDVTVNNKYAPAGTATAVIHIDKRVMSLSGEDKSAAGYTFELYDESGSLVATSGETSAAGETSIELTYDAKDAGTTFHYTLKETHSGETHNGLTYDSTVYNLSVSVVDNMDGTIRAYVYNTADYKTELLTIQPEEIESEETESEETESEETEPEETKPEVTDAPVETAAPSEGGGEISQGDTQSVEIPIVSEPVVESTEPDPVQTETAVSPPVEEPILIEEDAAAPIPIPVDGAPSAAPEEEEEPDLESNEEALEEEEKPADESQPEIQPSEGAEEPSEPIEITLQPAAEPETKEVVVVPAGAGDTYEVSFENTYDPADTQATFGGTKELQGRDLNDGEFCFDLYATGDGFTVTEDMVPVQSVANNADGSFAFAAIGYDAVGTYRYVVKENDSAKLGGVTYDDAVFHVTVTVADENGVLTADTAITDELGAAAELAFQNSYKAAAASITITGTKTLTGMDLAADMFRFRLYPADESYTVQGEPLAGASNAATGDFAFDSITCSQSGIFYYVVTEDISQQTPGMTYDDTVYGVKVSVWDDGSGVLKASATMIEVGAGEVDAIVFANSYTEPEPSHTPTPSGSVDSDVPPTGDDSPILLLAGMLLLCAAGVAVVVSKRKKN